MGAPPRDGTWGCCDQVCKRPLVHAVAAVAGSARALHHKRSPHVPSSHAAVTTYQLQLVEAVLQRLPEPHALVLCLRVADALVHLAQEHLIGIGQGGIRLQRCQRRRVSVASRVDTGQGGGTCGRWRWPWMNGRTRMDGWRMVGGGKQDEDEKTVERGEMEEANAWMGERSRRSVE